MEEDLRFLVQKTYDLALENNKMLHAMQRKARWNSVWRAFYWIIIIGISIWSFYYLQPYIEKITQMYGAIKNTETKMQEMKGSLNFTDFFKDSDPQQSN